MSHLTTESTFFYKIVFKNEEGNVVLEDESWDDEEIFARERAKETLAELIRSTGEHHSAEITLCLRPRYI